MWPTKNYSVDDLICGLERERDGKREKEAGTDVDIRVRV